MIESITVTNSKNESLKIVLTNPWASGFCVTNIEGLGPVKASINTTSYATRDGSAFNSARLDNRNIVFSFRFIPYEANTAENIRQASYKYFPIKSLITIRIKTTNRDCETTGYVESNEPDIFQQNETAQISVICPDPYFYDSSSKQDISFFDTVPTFHFPFYNEGTETKTIVFGERKILKTKEFTYDGEGRTGFDMMLYFSGEVTGKITIKNETTEQSFIIDTSLFSGTLADYKIKDGDQLKIRTIPGNKLVRFWKKQTDSTTVDFLTTDILYCVASGSDWLEVAPGSNKITISADSGEDYITASVTTVVKYEGV